MGYIDQCIELTRDHMHDLLVDCLLFRTKSQPKLSWHIKESAIRFPATFHGKETFYVSNHFDELNILVE
jgi:hypothetical protein